MKVVRNKFGYVICRISYIDEVVKVLEGLIESLML